MRLFVPSIFLCLLLGCGGGGGGSSGGSDGGINIQGGPGTPVNGPNLPPPPAANADVPLIVSAGLQTLTRVANGAAIVGQVDLARLGLSSVDDVYDLTTPTDEPLALHVTTREANNDGNVEVAVAHALAAGSTPVGNVGSLGAAGLVPSTMGSFTAGLWLLSTGDGFARLTLQGSIDARQTLALRVTTAAGTRVALLRLRPGQNSPINLDRSPVPSHPGQISSQEVYSSPSSRFGLPVLALSGDRATVLSYEGDRVDATSTDRYEMRVQVDLSTLAITGGGVQENNPDPGNWRDHELAGLFNVLARAHAGSGALTVDLSFDRGASFTQTEAVPTGAVFPNRLVQVAIAADYSLAVAFWRRTVGQAELLLLEGQPSAFDANGSPSAYSFSPPVAVYASGEDLTPNIIGVAWSAGGDLVIGYGFSLGAPDASGNWVTTTESRCAVRIAGQTMADQLVSIDQAVTFDPSVGVVGIGQNLGIFYAYETELGIQLRVSNDHGQTWTSPLSFGDASSHQPSVMVREQAGATRVDLLYIHFRNAGAELHVVHWDDFVSRTHTTGRLTTSTMTDVGGSTELVQLGWLGYDAVLDGDDVLVCIHEQTIDTGALVSTPVVAQAIGTNDPPEIFGAAPPPLAPGLTQPVAAFDASHAHRLRLVRLD